MLPLVCLQEYFHIASIMLHRRLLPYFAVFFWSTHAFAVFLIQALFFSCVHLLLQLFHCVPAVSTKRISITFRRMTKSKHPWDYVVERDLQGLQPLLYGQDESKTSMRPTRGD
ncbi:hypothetical protein Droror1_Dr00027925 [Drosera rotundifolia]